MGIFPKRPILVRLDPGLPRELQGIPPTLLWPSFLQRHRFHLFLALWGSEFRREVLVKTGRRLRRRPLCVHYDRDYKCPLTFCLFWSVDGADLKGIDVLRPRYYEHRAGEVAFF